MEGKQQGSFGIPEVMKKQMEEFRAKKDTPEEKKPEPTPAPEQDLAKPVEKTQEEKNQEDVLKAKAEWERQLGISLTEQDIEQYIFQGRVIKDKISIVCHSKVKLVGTFQSQTPEDSSAIDERMCQFRDAKKFTQQGLANEEALWILAYCWTRANDRPLGDTPDKRYQTIRKMGDLTVNLAYEALKIFNLLLKLSLREDNLIKKF